jgi:hypothetical protein
LPGGEKVPPPICALLLHAKPGFSRIPPYNAAMAEPDHKRCLGCGYILDGLPEPRCPECGRGFDLANTETYWWRPAPGRVHLIAAVSGFALVVLGITLSYAASRPLGEWCPVPFLFGAFLIELLVLDRAIRALRGPRDLVRNRSSLVLGLVICILFWVTLAISLIL